MKIKLLLLLSCMGASAYAMEPSKGAFDEFLDAYGEELSSQENYSAPSDESTEVIEQGVTPVGVPVQAPIIKASLLQMVLPAKHKRSNEAAESSVSDKRIKNSYVCQHEACNYTTSDARNFARHNRVHTGEKPFACDYEGCGKTFSTKNYLTSHAFTHTGEKQFACTHEGCTKAYIQPCALRRHMRDDHKK